MDEAAIPSEPKIQARSGLTGRTVLLPSDDAAAYEHHIQRYIEDLQPVGPREQALAQSLADNAWRLDRIPALEMSIYAIGRTQFEHEDAALRPGLIEVNTYLAYEKQLRNLSLQEARLRRQREKDTAELRQLQQERMQKEKQQLDAAAKLYTAAKRDNKPFDPAAFGFVFSTAVVEAFLARQEPKAHLRAA